MKRAIRITACAMLLCAAAAAAVFHDVREYGAKGDGASKDTQALQAAIDATEKQGGGVVVVPAGKYLCGTIHLKSNITLNLTSGAVIMASRDEGDFDPYEKLPYSTPDDKETTYFHYALLAGENIHDVSITGAGVVDGNRPKRGGPKTIAFKNCEHISIRGVTVRNSPNYSISFLGCDYIDVDGVTILNGYADGIDPDSSRYVRIANCFIDCWDDAICPKASMALGKRRSTEQLVVTNCVISTNCANFKLGTESGGDFKNISFSNSVMLKRVGNERGAVSGISLESVDGSNIDGVVVSNITMQDAGTPIFIRLGNRGRGMSPAIPGTAANISISNVIATRGAMASSVTGLNGHPVRAVTLDNINISMIGGVGAFNGLNVPEVENKYPEATMFGHLPAYALYARHVEGLTLRNIKTRWQKQDVRPAMILDDIKDLEIIGFRSETSPAFHPVAWFHNVSGALMQGSRVAEELEQFLRITGPRSRDIMLTGNDLRRARKVIDLGSGVPPEVVRMDR